jgi:hypothetical protein
MFAVVSVCTTNLITVVPDVLIAVIAIRVVTGVV